jgi:two-component system chemotaxis response regulator CheB
MNKPIRVLIIDDSELFRNMLTVLLNTDPNIEVVGTAADPYIAREEIKRLNPDVLTLDIEMPRMDGITFLRNLMRLHPMPVVMLSGLTEKSTELTLKALELGAVDFIQKPALNLQHGAAEYGCDIIETLKTAASAHTRPLSHPAAMLSRTAGQSVDNIASNQQYYGSVCPLATAPILAIGASTGGTEAIKALLAALPASTPGTVITQHIPAAFSGPFAARMDRSSAMQVCEARHGQEILSGHVYIAPGGRHLRVVCKDSRYFCNLSDASPVNRHRPSVDVMFRSLVESAGANTLAVLLTGMGADGAAGMKELRETGALTIAQDKNSSVIWGMPGMAVKLGAADMVLPLTRIPLSIMAWMQQAKEYGT